MTEEANSHFTLEQLRRFYSEELRIVADLESPDLVSAFARVPRERYLGAPPWKFSSGNSLKQSSYRTTSSVCDVYHDVFVALKSEKFLNNGQPSMIARLIAALNLGHGKRVFHCGCGTGYYTAIMAEVVGSKGSVVAAEIDSTLAEIAVANLKNYDHVKVLNDPVLPPTPTCAASSGRGVTARHKRASNSLTPEPRHPTDDSPLHGRNPAGTFCSARTGSPTSNWNSWSWRTAVLGTDSRSIHMAAMTGTLNWMGPGSVKKS